MRICAAVSMLAAVAITLAPPRAVAHGGEFLLAKVAFPGRGRVEIQITADYSGANPMIDGEGAAALAIADVLRVREAGGSRPLNAFAVPRFSKSSQFDPSSPYAAMAEAGNEAHRLLSATWSWKPSSASLAFEIPHGNPYDVVLWTVTAGAPEKNPRWLYLIADDFTPAIEIPKPPLIGVPESAGICVLVLCAAVPVVIRTRRKRAREALPA